MSCVDNSATNPNSTTHNSSQHRGGCLFPSPIRISLVQLFSVEAECLAQYVVLPRDAMLAAADRHLAGLCEYSVPQGGMFLWMRVPGLSSTWDMIMKVSRAASREDFTIKEKAPTSSSIRAFSVITKLRVDLRLKLYSSRSAASRGTSC